MNEKAEGNRMMCACGRGKIFRMVCDACTADAASDAEAFWSFMDGTITYAGFIRRLRRK